MILKDILVWLTEQLVKAEKSVIARDQLSENRRLTDAQVKELMALPGTVVGIGRKISKKAAARMEAARVEDIARQKRIAAICRRDVAMLKTVKAIIEKLSQPQP
jgi:hypothetical protein